MSEGKTNGRNNKNRGSNWERDTVNALKKIGFVNAGTSRLHSRERDNAKVDITNANESINGRLPYNIQCKSVSKHVDYAKILSEMPQDGSEINVIFHKQTKKTDGGTFRKVGTFAILPLEDFYEIMRKQLELEDEVKAWSNIM